MGVFNMDNGEVGVNIVSTETEYLVSTFKSLMSELRDVGKNLSGERSTTFETFDLFTKNIYSTGKDTDWPYDLRSTCNSGIIDVSGNPTSLFIDTNYSEKPRIYIWGDVTFPRFMVEFEVDNLDEILTKYKDNPFVNSLFSLYEEYVKRAHLADCAYRYSYAYPIPIYEDNLEKTYFSLVSFLDRISHAGILKASILSRVEKSGYKQFVED